MTKCCSQLPVRVEQHFPLPPVALLHLFSQMLAANSNLNRKIASVPKLEECLSFDLQISPLVGLVDCRGVFGSPKGILLLAEKT